MKTRLTNRLHAALQRYLPEQRLFLKSDKGMRYVRLRPGTQAVMLLGSALIVGWTVIVTAIFLIDSITAGSAREQNERAQLTYQTRLNAISEERDLRATEALASQERFSVAMDEVSEMQSRLLASEERRRELETAVEVIQTTLRRVMAERDAARENFAELQQEIEADNGEIETTQARLDSLEGMVGYLSLALSRAADQRDDAVDEAGEAEVAFTEVQFASALADERNERIFAQLEDAAELSLAPLEQMFRAAGLDADALIRQVRNNYAGEGGPLTPIVMSSRGEEPSLTERRANEVLDALNLANMYRIAAESLPFSFPVRGRYTFTSPFGMRRGRPHNGVDMAGPVGTPIHAAGDGVVIFAGRQSGYGNLIEIRHANGYTTRYAHLNRIRVSNGQRVSRDQRIGDMGNTGRSTGPHLHYEIRRNGTPLNPMRFITAGRNVF